MLEIRNRLAYLANNSKDMVTAMSCAILVEKLDMIMRVK